MDTSITKAKHISKQGKKGFRQLTKSPLTYRFVRLGFLIRGILYCFIGLFAFGFALGVAHKVVKQDDVIIIVSQLSVGYPLLMLFAAGLLGYAVWGLIRMTRDLIDNRVTHISLFQRGGYLLSCLFYTSLLIPTINLLMHKKIFATKAFTFHDIARDSDNLPFGFGIVIVIGLLLCVAGIMQIRKAFLARQPSDVDYATGKVKAKQLFMLISRGGISIRGFVWSILGIYLILSVINTDPTEAKSMTEVFIGILTFPFGHFILGVIAIGLFLFGLYSISMSLWADLPSHD